MSAQKNFIGIPLVVIGIAFLIIFKNTVPGSIGGVLLVLAGIFMFIKGRRNQS